MGTLLIRLVALSSLVLLQELALIRWLGAEVRVVAFFPNLILLSAFLGLGLGALLSRRRSLLAAWLPLLLLLGLSAWGLSGVAFTEEDPTDHLWLLYYDLGDDAPVVRGVRLPLVVLFVLSTLTFVPPGQAVGATLQACAERGRALVGYAADLLGSLLGVVVFALLSFAETFPLAWFLLLTAGIVGVVLSTRERGPLLLAGTAAAALLGVVSAAEDADLYSPYYALTVEDGERGTAVSGNGSLHQIFLDLREGAPLKLEIQRWIREGYHRPYRALNRPIRKALVLGAGTGNDVAVLLDEGAAEVHAVEIDPVILRIGQSRHPAAPYSDPRVKVFNTDARAYLQHTDERYDVIVFGTLDSLTRLSAMSTVRLDNFVYTEDGLRQAASRLTDDGALVLFFMASHGYIRRHLDLMLYRVFDRVPVQIAEHRGLFNVTFMAGPGFAHLPQPPPPPPALLELDAPTDRWPFLYLERPRISTFYASTMALLLALALLLVAGTRRLAGVGSHRPSRSAVTMMLFGAAFLLMETGLITTMNLVWGATWLSSAVVFGAFLSMVLLATLLTARRELPWPVTIGGLLVSLVAAALISPSHLVGLSTPLRLGGSLLYAGLPVFFASVAFAREYRRQNNAADAFGWNVIGAVAGGLLEFLSMRFGLTAPGLMALTAYIAIAALVATRPSATTSGA
jgi:spermidine synthase